MDSNKPQILLTNDDGIESPGLWAAAEALSDIGYVWVVAPREQSSGMGHSMPTNSDGIISTKQLTVNGKEWTIYAVGGSPAQAVQHGIFEVIQHKPDLVVSGINYGLNVGMTITISGTVGAALEGAFNQIPSLAISIETPLELHLSYSKEVNFRTAGHFTKYFGQILLDGKLDERVQILKVDLPADANEETPWEITRLSNVRYYLPNVEPRKDWNQPVQMSYRTEEDLSLFPEDSDVYTVLKKRLISVTPMQMDLTAPVDFKQLEQSFRGK
jgi:5'-nucleotidase